MLQNKPNPPILGHFFSLHVPGPTVQIEREDKYASQAGNKQPEVSGG